MHVEIIFLVDTSAWDVEVPGASDGRTAEDRDADGNEDIRYLKGADRVGEATEGTVGVNAEVEEQDRELHGEGTEVVGCEGAEINLEKCYDIVSGEVPKIDTIAVWDCWRCCQQLQSFFEKGRVQTSSRAEKAHEKIFEGESASLSDRRRKKYQSNDEKHFSRMLVDTLES